MIIKRKELIIWPSVLIVLLFLGWIIFKEERAAADQIITNVNINSDITEETSEIINPNTFLADNNTNTDNQQLITNDLSLPILMYHHIRDFNDPGDQAGITLSVSPTDFNKMLDLIEEKDYNTITFRDILEGNVPDKSVILTFDDGYENFYENAYPELLRRGLKAVSYIIVNNIGKKSYLNESQIIEMSNSGIEIGSHTLSHPDLSKSSESTIKKEILNSKTSLESKIGKKIYSICYPAGKYNEAVLNYVREAGYSFAVTTNTGISTFKDPFTVNRYRVNNGTSISGWIK